MGIPIVGGLLRGLFGGNRRDGKTLRRRPVEDADTVQRRLLEESLLRHRPAGALGPSGAVFEVPNDDLLPFAPDMMDRKYHMGAPHPHPPRRMSLSSLGPSGAAFEAPNDDALPFARDMEKMTFAPRPRRARRQPPSATAPEPRRRPLIDLSRSPLEGY